MKQHRIFESLEYIFNPLFPGFITAGLSAGFASLISQFTSAGNQSIFYVFLSLINNAFTIYLPVWVGWQGASKFGASPVLGAMMGTVTILDEIDQGVKAGSVPAVLFFVGFLSGTDVFQPLDDDFIPLLFNHFEPFWNHDAFHAFVAEEYNNHPQNNLNDKFFHILHCFLNNIYYILNLSLLSIL